jgi:hypothetical protein
MNRLQQSWRRGPLARVRWHGREMLDRITRYGADHRPSKPGVAGSSPAGRATFSQGFPLFRRSSHEFSPAGPVRNRLKFAQENRGSSEGRWHPLAPPILALLSLIPAVLESCRMFLMTLLAKATRPFSVAPIAGPLKTHRRAYVLCCCCRKVIAESLEPADTNDPVVRTSIGPCGPCLHDRIRRN